MPAQKRLAQRFFSPNAAHEGAAPGVTRACPSAPATCYREAWALVGSSVGFR